MQGNLACRCSANTSAAKLTRDVLLHGSNRQRACVSHATYVQSKRPVLDAFRLSASTRLPLVEPLAVFGVFGDLLCVSEVARWISGTDLD